MKIHFAFLTVLVFATLQSSGTAQAQTSEEAPKECKNLAIAINGSSRTALQQKDEDKAAAEKAIFKIFSDCDKFVNEFKCTKATWSWLDTNMSLSNYCYEAILTERRRRQEAAQELLEKSKNLRPAKTGSSQGKDKASSQGAIR